MFNMNAAPSENDAVTEEAANDPVSISPEEQAHLDTFEQFSPVFVRRGNGEVEDGWMYIGQSEDGDVIVMKQDGDDALRKKVNPKAFLKENTPIDIEL
jgi:hypothetical protein